MRGGERRSSSRIAYGGNAVTVIHSSNKIIGTAFCARVGVDYPLRRGRMGLLYAGCSPQAMPKTVRRPSGIVFQYMLVARSGGDRVVSIMNHLSRKVVLATLYRLILRDGLVFKLSVSLVAYIAA